MGGYLLNFIVYTAAMIGIIFAALFVYKKTAVNFQSSSKFLKVEDSISLSPRKQLFVVRAGNERFLVASDAERTNLISKLEVSQNKNHTSEICQETEIPERVRHFESYSNSKSAIKNFARKLDL